MLQLQETTSIKPLQGCSAEQTLLLMDLWIGGHKMSAALKYDVIVGNSVLGCTKTTLGTFYILASYFNEF